MQLVHYAQGVLDGDLCRSLIVLFAAGNACGIAKKLDEGYRCCTQLALPHAEMPCGKVLMDRFVEAIRPAVESFKLSAGGTTPLGFCSAIEQPSILLYQPGKDPPEEFLIHADVWNAESASRQLSIIAYLNDVQEGGETIFPELGMQFKPLAGSVLIFPAFYTHMHYAKPPISENKFCVVTWLHFQGAKYLTYPF